VRVTVLGTGAVGYRVVEHLARVPGVERIDVLARASGRNTERLDRRLAEGFAGPATVRLHRRRAEEPTGLAADVTVITVPAGVRARAAAALAAGSHVVCPVDDPADVRHLLDLDGAARVADRAVVAGTALAPGLSCLLAAYVAPRFDQLDEIHVASLGTGGPACARRHHAALAGIALDWSDGTWRRRAGGSGRELVWFPEPVGGADCYRAALADPLLLVPAFPRCRRITSRLAATRRDRLTSWLPMLRPPHPEGLVGAVRVEARGWVSGRPETVILGAARPPAVVAATVTAVAARWAGEGRLYRSGAAGLASMVDQPGAFLTEVAAAGVPVLEFEGEDA
jgi:saccharopine dehydrogenase-like NADP-dependent oxidoreductase